MWCQTMSTIEVINPEELAELRREDEKWFTDFCDIYKVGGASESSESDSDDAYGGTDDDYGGIDDRTETLFQSHVSCMIESSTAHEQTRVVMGVLRETQLFTVTLPALTEINVGDHVIVTTQSNLHLRVQAVLNPESWEIERRVIGSEEGQHAAPA